MASVSYPEVCQQCQFSEALGSLQTRTGDESLFCPRCGYSLDIKAVIDRRKQKRDPQKRAWLKHNKAGRILFRAYQRPGHGAYCLATSDGVQVMGRFTGPVNLQSIRWFKIQLRRQGVDLTRSYMTRANGHKVKAVLGQPPLPTAE